MQETRENSNGPNAKFGGKQETLFDGTVFLLILGEIYAPTAMASFPLPTVTTVTFDPYATNLTVVDMTPRSIGLRWSCSNHHLHDKYELTLKPLKAT